jgi:hypothetical protein
MRDGSQPSEPRERRFEWDTLRNHAVFPAGETTLSWALTKGPLGEQGCWVYRHTEPPQALPDGTKSPVTVTVYYMAEELPGPPIRYENWENDSLTTSYTQVARWVKK